jgi:hypothetical protein
MLFTNAGVWSPDAELFSGTALLFPPFPQAQKDSSITAARMMHITGLFRLFIIVSPVNRPGQTTPDDAFGPEWFFSYFWISGLDTIIL